MESAETSLRKLKINYTLEAIIGTNNEEEFWIRLSPIMSINLPEIPWERRSHLKTWDHIVLTVDLEPRNAQPKGPSEQ